MSDGTVTELFAEIVEWATRHGAKNIPAMDGLWRGETDEWIVEINGHADEVDDVPPYSARLKHKIYVAFAVVGVRSGEIIGAKEDDLIEHFRSAR